MKIIVGLGNPGEEYARTRHNVGWWVLERLAEEWRLGGFRKDGKARVASGRVDGESVRLLAPQTWMNNSGQALGPLRNLDDFDVQTDLLVVVDEAALEPGRLRIRAEGSPGGHNGLKSVQAVLGTQQYARLRIGIGGAPPGWDLSDWVLSAPSKEDRDAIVALFPTVVEGVRVWINDGVEAAARLLNR